MSVPTNETGLALAAVDFGGNTCGSWVGSESELSPVSTVDPETNLEALEGLLGRQSLSVAHGGGQGH